MSTWTAPLTRTITAVLSDWLEDPEMQKDIVIEDIAANIARILSPQPDPDDPRKWVITLPTADGTRPDS